MTRADDERRRALALLVENPDGCSRAIMLARGFPLALLNRLVRAGLATSHIEREERGDNDEAQ
jgi:predicted transcriptional regulator